MYLPASQVPIYFVPLTFEILSEPKLFYEENKQKEGDKIFRMGCQKMSKEKVKKCQQKKGKKA